MTTTATETRVCKTCGAAFTARCVTGVVRCTECRKARREGGTATAKTTFVAKKVTAAGRTCTVRGAFGVCGKTAVHAFETAFGTGEVFAECAEHHHG